MIRGKHLLSYCEHNWSMPSNKQKFPANPWNTLNVSAELSANVSLTKSTAMNLGQDPSTVDVFVDIRLGFSEDERHR